MGHGWRDVAGHHAWANVQLLAFCQGLDGPTLDTTVPGTYGTILETLQHLVEASGVAFESSSEHGSERWSKRCPAITTQLT